MSSIELGGNTVPTLPAIANQIIGMDFGGANVSATGGGVFQQGAGFSVADVGTVNSQPYDDFVIGAPTTKPGNPGSLGSLPGSAVYLVFGSQTVNSATITDWLATTNTTPPTFKYTPNDRVGDLAQLGNSPQTNPISTTQLNFPFPGVTLYTGTNLNSNLGASVAGLTVNGMGAILLGAPGAPDASGNNPGTGRAYLLWGNFQAQIGKGPINLDLPAATFATTYPGLNLVTFVNSTSPGGGLGSSVAGGSNILGDGASDVILGAPSAGVGVAPTSIGAVYMISAATLNPSSVVDVSTFGATRNNSQVILTGANSAGFSVADGGNVNGVSTNIHDLLIGAPTADGGGAAYLVYGTSNFSSLETLTNNVFSVNLNSVGAGGTGAVPGAIFEGLPSGSKTGFAVSSAGNFNGATNGATPLDGIMIGSPGTTIGTGGNTGQVDVFYGAPSNSANFLNGVFNLANLPSATPPRFELTGANAGDMAGYALANTGPINPNAPTILIGAPGFNGGSGTAYLIPARANFTGTFSLSQISSSPTAALVGLQFTLTNGTTANFFGASVSSRLQDGQQFTADGDSVADFIIGAPGYDVTQTTGRTQAGGGLVVQGALIPGGVPIPSAAAIVTQIGVGTPFPPFSINNTTPANLQIFVFGSLSTTPAFMPVEDINPATVVVNGIAFPNATLVQDPNTNNYLNGIPDAIITISPRSALNLQPGTTTITISGTTLATSPLPGRTWTGTASPVTVTGGTITPVIGGVVGLAPGPVTATIFNSAFGNTQFVPTLSQLSAYNYQPLPIALALNQFLPAVGFRDRNYIFNHPGKHLTVNVVSRGQPIGRVGGFNQLRKTVFDRGRFHPQRLYTWAHRPPKYGALVGVVPTQTRIQRYQDLQLTGG
jgi:hypothetical protein